MSTITSSRRFNFLKTLTPEKNDDCILKGTAEFPGNLLSPTQHDFSFTTTQRDFISPAKYTQVAKRRHYRISFSKQRNYHLSSSKKIEEQNLDLLAKEIFKRKVAVRPLKSKYVSRTKSFQIKDSHLFEMTKREKEENLLPIVAKKAVKSNSADQCRLSKIKIRPSTPSFFRFGSRKSTPMPDNTRVEVKPKIEIKSSGCFRPRFGYLFDKQGPVSSRRSPFGGGGGKSVFNFPARLETGSTTDTGKLRKPMLAKTISSNTEKIDRRAHPFISKCVKVPSIEILTKRWFSGENNDFIEAGVRSCGKISNQIRFDNDSDSCKLREPRDPVRGLHKRQMALINKIFMTK